MAITKTIIYIFLDHFNQNFIKPQGLCPKVKNAET